MNALPPDLRCKFWQTTGACPTEDMTKAISRIFDEFQSSLSEKEIFHPSEKCHRQGSRTFTSQTFDVINSYHIFCRLCKKHFYSRSRPTDINSFFQEHINNDYHLEFRDSQFSHWKDMFTWEEEWITGRCNVCQMSGLNAFFLDRGGNPENLLKEHRCVWGFVMKEINQEFLRKISRLKKYCQLSIFRDKFIKPLDEGSACLLCCSKIPWSGENVKLHLGNPSHTNRFFWLVRKQFNFSSKDFLNGFNLEMILRWIYCCTFKPVEELQSEYHKTRRDCYLTTNGPLTFDLSSKSDRFCPKLIEDLRCYQPGDFIQAGICLLCDQPAVDEGKLNYDHFKSEYHQSKAENLSEESFGNLDRYKAFCANRYSRLGRHAELIEKYKKIKEGTHVLSLAVPVKNFNDTCLKKLFFQKLSLVKKPPSEVLNEEHVCKVCDLHVPASRAVNHATDLVHLYNCRKWKELEKCAKDKRFFDFFDKVQDFIVCLLCGVSGKPSHVLSHLKGTMHTKRFEWYCTLKNEVPIFSAIKVRVNLSVVCYLCESVLLERGSKKEFKMKLKSLRKHWPCPLVIEMGGEAEESLKPSENREKACLSCGCNQEAHKSDCPTNSLNFKNVESAIRNTLDSCESVIFKRVLNKTKSVIQQIELAIMANGKQRQGTACKFKRTRSQPKRENTNGDLPKREVIKKKHETVDNADNDEGQEEKERESTVEVNQPPPGIMTAVLKKGNEKRGDAISKRCDSADENLKLPRLPPDLLKLLQQPSELMELIAKLTSGSGSESVHELEREKLVCTTINNAVMNLFPRCRCYPFGSRLSGLMFSDSDLDVFLDCRGMYEGMENLPSSVEKNLIHMVAKLLRKNREITKLVIIDRARVPILSFFHKSAGIRCDLSFKNLLSVRNTLLIKFLMSLDLRVKFIITFFKYWIKKNGIHGQPFFSSYAISMMAIFYLQQLEPPMIPTVEELQNAFVGPRLTMGGWDCSFSMSPGTVLNKVHYVPLHVILHGLFNYYANFDYVKFAISPLHGKPLPREAFSYNSLVELPMCYKRHILNFPQPLEKLVSQEIPICVIDPFDLSHVLTKGVTQNGLQMFKHFCQLSANALQKSTLISNNDTLVREDT